MSRRRPIRRTAGAHLVEPRGARHRLLGWERRLLFASGGLLLATGAVWLGVHYLRSADALPSPAEAWLMRTHGLAAFAALFVFGALAVAHVPRGWRLASRRDWKAQRATGLCLCLAAGGVALTGYLLYYFAPDSVRPAIGWVHSALGLAMALLVLAHRRGSEGL